MKKIKIIAIESDYGAGTRGAKLGPQALLKAVNNLNSSLLSGISVHAIIPDEPEIMDLHPTAKNIDTVINVQNRIIELVQHTLSSNEFPFIISGDHSNGLAGISALKNFYAEDSVGVIWIDAHADIHSPYTSPSGNLHGMPLAAAMGIGSTKNDKNNINIDITEKWNELLTLGDKKITPKLKPENIVFIDIRDLEDEEISILKERNIKFFTPEHKKEAGISSIIKQTLAHLAKCEHLLVSFDVDSLDPTVSFGTGTPVPGGLSEQEAVELLTAFMVQPNLKLFEITEINPILDRQHPMEEVAAEIIVKILPALLA
nr:arginase [Pseudopedobacter sp.]